MQANRANGEDDIQMISIERIMQYLRAYDEYYEAYPEHPWEGEAVGKWMIECAFGDGLISEEEYKKYHIEELNW